MHKTRDQNKQLKLTHANISLLKTFDHVATFVYLLIFLLPGWKQSYHVKQSYLNAWRKGHGNYRMVNLNVFAKFTERQLRWRRKFSNVAGKEKT